MIKVAYCNVKDLDLNKAYALLPENRKEKVDNLIFDSDKKASCGSYLLLKKILQEEGIDEPVITSEKNCKPYLSNFKDLHFNLSHSGQMVTCAISDKEVGIDIEKKDPMIDFKVSKNFFYNSEFENIKKSDDKANLFFEYWVLKESYMKYTGLGFELDLDKFEIIRDDEIKVKNQIDDLKEDEDKVKFSLFDIGRYKFAICSEYEVDSYLEYDIKDIL